MITSWLFNDVVRNIHISDILDFDTFCEGFLCQPISLEGQIRGFDGYGKSERENLFFLTSLKLLILTKLNSRLR